MALGYCKKCGELYQLRQEEVSTTLEQMVNGAPRILYFPEWHQEPGKDTVCDGVTIAI